MSFINQRSEILIQFDQVCNDKISFEEFSFRLFEYQLKFNTVYSDFIKYSNHLKGIPSCEDEIPFLPIQFFKKHKISTGDWESNRFFLSSGTGSKNRSVHHINDLNFYLQNAVHCFEQSYGSVSDYCFIALLPAYVDNKHSSLITMVNHFIECSKYEQSGYYLSDIKSLLSNIEDCLGRNIPTILFSVSFALVDFAEQCSADLNGLIIMETGGMKGRKKEKPRDYIHKLLQKSFNVQSVHSEYGMTELFSQAYSKSDGIFFCPKQQKVIITEINDPFTTVLPGQSGIINIVDLANIDTCAFIATQDIGRKLKNGSFEILGRHDISDLRGCNLLLE